MEEIGERLELPTVDGRPVALQFPGGGIPPTTATPQNTPLCGRPDSKGPDSKLLGDLSRRLQPDLDPPAAAKLARPVALEFSGGDPPQPTAAPMNTPLCGLPQSHSFSAELDSRLQSF